MTFYFYDLETSGFNPREDRIMQFGGQRTDLDLKPIGEPHNFFIKMTPDVLPSPDAILVTGITPQQTITDGINEAEFLKIFVQEIATPGTIFVGFNSIRFDDEFMRFLLYRNFYDPYIWQWQDGRSRWDLLDMVRLTRALRPEGIKWPVDSEGKPANRLGLLTSINGLDHASAHDALGDVQATIALAQLLKSKQPKLFDYLLPMRDKKKVAELVNAGQPFVYASGKLASEFEKTSVVVKLADHPKRQGALVYDLRFDPTPWATLTPEQLAEAWKYKKDSDEPRLPVKTLAFNRCPAVAPLGVLDKPSQERLQIDLEQTQKNLSMLRTQQGFVANVLKALELLDTKQQEAWLEDEQLVDARLYDGFFADQDKTAMREVHTATVEDLKSLSVNFTDKRLTALLPLYKARNFPKSLNEEEQASWEQYRSQKLVGGKLKRAEQYFRRLEELASQKSLSDNQRYLLEELKLWGESLIPEAEV